MTKQRAVKAARKRGLIDRDTARTALAILAPRRTPIIQPAPPPAELWAEFARLHGACEQCHGKDPFCNSLTGSRWWNVFHFPSDMTLDNWKVLDAVRRLARPVYPKVKMTEGTKARLRERAVEKRSENGGLKCPVPVLGSLLVKAGKETAGPFRLKIQKLCMEAIAVSELVKKATELKIPTPGWKITDMLKRGQLIPDSGPGRP